MLIKKSKNLKIKELSEKLERHHRGKLPKCYYSSDGHLYGKSLTGKDKPDECMKRDKDADRIAEERSKESLRNAPKQQKPDSI